MEPRYAYDPSLARPQYIPPIRESWVNDLRAMGGTEARKLTFGATFGTTSGFLMARFLMTLLKIGVFVGICALFVIWVRWNSRDERSIARTTVETQPVAHLSRVETLRNQRQNALAALTFGAQSWKQDLAETGSIPRGAYQECMNLVNRVANSEYALAEAEDRQPDPNYLADPQAACAVFGHTRVVPMPPAPDMNPDVKAYLPSNAN